MGTITNPIAYPIVMIVDVIASSRVQSRTSNDTANKKKMPQIKANLDKNNSQRIDDFRLK